MSMKYVAACKCHLNQAHTTYRRSRLLLGFQSQGADLEAQANAKGAEASDFIKSKTVPEEDETSRDELERLLARVDLLFQRSHRCTHLVRLSFLKKPLRCLSSHICRLSYLFDSLCIRRVHAYGVSTVQQTERCPSLATWVLGRMVLARTELQKQKVQMLLTDMGDAVKSAELKVKKAVEAARKLQPELLHLESVEHIKEVTEQTSELEKDAALTCAEARKRIGMKLRLHSDLALREESCAPVVSFRDPRVSPAFTKLTNNYTLTFVSEAYPNPIGSEPEQKSELNWNPPTTSGTGANREQFQPRCPHVMS
eukprot:6472672-Amphidinium_carterae.1